MERKDFIHKATRIGLGITLIGLTALVGRKIVIKKDCNTCPDYAACPGKEKCDIIASKP